MRGRVLATMILLAAMVVALNGRAADSGLPPLSPATTAAWDAYIAAVEARRTREAAASGRFLALDSLPSAGRERAALAEGRVVIEPVSRATDQREPVEVPRALVHHWRGAVFLPGATVSGVLADLRRGPPAQADVLQRRVLAATGDRMRVFLRLRRTRIVTVVFDTEHDVRFTQYDADRAASTTRALVIREVADAGTATERHVLAGEDHGFLWRLQAYWRYVAVPGGVIAECESVSLSRGVPFGLRTVARPLIAGAARDALTSALVAVRAAVTEVQ